MPEERPREKFIEKGRSAVSNVELLALLLSNGTRGKSAIDLARELLLMTEGRLDVLSTAEIEELCSISGIGKSKAVILMAAFELARRIDFKQESRTPVLSSQDAFNSVKHELLGLDYEVFYVLVMDRANKLIKSIQISKGGLSGTVVDPKTVFKSLLRHKLASACIFAHNHPSGNLKPSEADKRLTEKLCKAGQVLDIRVLDHLIIGHGEYFSFADNGLMPSN